jgi:hypothetical protein
MIAFSTQAYVYGFRIIFSMDTLINDQEATNIYNKGFYVASHVDNTRKVDYPLIKQLDDSFAFLICIKQPKALKIDRNSSANRTKASAIFQSSFTPFKDKDLKILYKRKY